MKEEQRVLYLKDKLKSLQVLNPHRYSFWLNTIDTNRYAESSNAAIILSYKFVYNNFKLVESPCNEAIESLR